MAQKEHEDQPAKPVRDDDLAARETPFYAGQQYQATAATRKAELLHSGSRIGYIPDRADSPKLANMYVQDRVPYKRPGFRPGVTQQGPRPLPRDVEVNRTPAPAGTGAFVRYADGHTALVRERPELVEYHNSLHPDDDADEREDVGNDIDARDAYYGHKYW